jgi:hypothetical protein
MLLKDGYQTSPGVIFSVKDPRWISFVLPLFGLKVDNTMAGCWTKVSGESGRD